MCRLGVTLCNEGIVGGRDKAGDGIASDWDCEAVSPQERSDFFAATKLYLLTSQKIRTCVLHVTFMLYFFSLQSILQFHVSCIDIQAMNYDVRH